MFIDFLELGTNSSRHIQHLIGVIPDRRGWRQSLVVFPVNPESFLNDFTEFRKHTLLIFTMTATVEKAGATAHKTVIGFGPLDHFHIPVGVAHYYDDSMVARFVSVSGHIPRHRKYRDIRGSGLRASGD
jgi:hypothetical protein